VWGATLDATAKLVGLALADHVDEAGKCWPGLSRLAARTGLSRRAVQRALLRLESAGVTIERRPGISSLFHIPREKGVSEVPESPRTQAPVTPRGRTSDTPGVPVTRVGRTSDARGVSQSREGGRTSDALTPQLNPPMNPPLIPSEERPDLDQDGMLKATARPEMVAFARSFRNEFSMSETYIPPESWWEAAREVGWNRDWAARQMLEFQLYQSGLSRKKRDAEGWLLEWRRYVNRIALSQEAPGAAQHRKVQPLPTIKELLEKSR